VPLVVVDAAFGGQLRGFADVKPDVTFKDRPYTPADLVGAEGYLAITLDPGEGMQRYQGVVALEGERITDALLNYFTYSQQLDVLFDLAVEKRDGEWMAGGFMLERIPGEGGLNAAPNDEQEESWRTSVALASTIKPGELLDPLLEGETLLYRLFHEDGVRVYPPQGLTTGCRCSRERILTMLMSMSIADRADMVVDGEVSVHCQFCNTTERFIPQDIGLPPIQ
jgi:molecular chaperone Hsp33